MIKKEDAPRSRLSSRGKEGDWEMLLQSFWNCWVVSWFHLERINRGTGEQIHKTAWGSGSVNPLSPKIWLSAYSLWLCGICCLFWLMISEQHFCKCLALGVYQAGREGCSSLSHRAVSLCKKYIHSACVKDEGVRRKLLHYLAADKMDVEVAE